MALLAATLSAFLALCVALVSSGCSARAALAADAAGQESYVYTDHVLYPWDWNDYHKDAEGNAVYCTEPGITSGNGYRVTKDLVGQTVRVTSDGRRFTWTQDAVTQCALALDYINSHYSGDEAYVCSQGWVWYWNFYGRQADATSDCTTYGEPLVGNRNIEQVPFYNNPAAVQAVADYVNAHKQSYVGRGIIYRATDEGSGGYDNQASLRLWTEPATGGVELRKTSAAPALTEGNALYALVGAVYGVYSDEACTQLAATMTTDESLHAFVDGLLTGSYWVKELTAPLGYELDGTVLPVTVVAGKTAQVNGGTVSDVPISSPGGVRVLKLDAETGGSAAQGDGSLAGAEFEVRYYAGYYETAAELPAEADRTWILKTDAEGRTGFSEAVADPATYLAGGDELFTDAEGAACAALGTYTIEETKAPEGYLLPEASEPSQADGTLQVVRASGAGGVAGTAGGTDSGADAAGGASARATVLNQTTQPEQVVRGGVTLHKSDLELHRSGGEDLADSVPLGAATLEGTQVTLANASAGSVRVNGVDYAPGEDVLVLTAGADGVLTTDEDGDGEDLTLPFGTYEARETAAPQGYVLDSGWRAEFEVREDGVVVNASAAEGVLELSDRVVRGDLSLTKANESSQARMAGVPFLITSLTTGEAHVVVTDQNGQLNTSSSFNAHTQATNASDAALGADGETIADESALDASAGVWFSGSASRQTEPDDALGALPYDRYEVRELACSANAGMTLVSIEVAVTRDGHAIDVGTVDDVTPLIETSLAGGGGEKTVAAADSVALTDEVAFERLEAGHEYTLKGELHLVSEDGSDGGVVATAEKTFTPKRQSSSTSLDFEVDTSSLQGRSLVAFERVYDGNVLVVAHEDLDDEAQTVRVPSVRTSAEGDATGGSDVPELAGQSVTDHVELANLTPGETYTVVGELRSVELDDDGNAADGGAVHDAAGSAATASTTFTATSREQGVDVRFSIDASALGGETVVVFERLYRDDVLLAEHADPSDEAQTLYVPDVRTTALDAFDADHELGAFEDQAVVDEVVCENLLVGREYTISGTLHVRSVGAGGAAVDEGELLDADGAPVTASAVFTASSATEVHELEFVFDASLLAGKDVVAFEELSRNGVLVAAHADITDEGQSDHVPAVSTRLTDAAGSHTTEVDPGAGSVTVSLTDQVAYRNLTPGEEYVLTGSLRLVAVGEDGAATDGGAVKDSKGEEIMASVTFVPEEKDGVVDVTFELDADAADLAGKTVVAFERLSHGEQVVAVHANPASESQSLAFVEPEPEPEPDEPVVPGIPATGEGGGVVLALGSGGALACGIAALIAHKRALRARRAKHLRRHAPSGAPVS